MIYFEGQKFSKNNTFDEGSWKIVHPEFELPLKAFRDSRSICRVQGLKAYNLRQGFRARVGVGEEGLKGCKV